MGSRGYRSPTGVATVVSRHAFIGLRYMTRERCQKLQSFKLVSRSVLGGVGDDVILY
jgi:hypothetical protein